MSQEQHNFLDELGLGRVIDYIKTKFASLSHSHKLSEITDYTVDSAMSSTSINPVQNKVINSALSGKVPTSRTINGKKLSSNITLSASDVGAATSSDVSSAKNEVQTNLDTHIDNADIHFSATERTKLSGIATGAEANVQSDWNVTDTTSDAYIKNKPSGAGTNLGLVKSGGDVTISNGVITVKDDSHNHVISNIDNLQSSLDAKATQNSLDSHTSDTTKHITSTERTSWNSAKTHADSAHAPSNAQANQNAFSNIKVGDTTISADTTTDTLTLVGSNVTITPDATNDKVTIAVASGSTSTKGIVQLTNSTSSTSTTTAATPNSVKSAYDLANTAKTNATTAQSKADSAYTLAESKVDSLSDLGVTATATELNYMDGVTSNVQTQLDGKASSSHKHTVSQISDLTATAAELNKLDGVTATTTELNYVDGVTSNIQTQLNSKITNNPFNGSGTSGEKGYIAFAQLKITQTYVNRPIEFELICRGMQTPCYVSIAFSNDNTTDPSIASLKYCGTDYGIFAVKSTTSTWLLYHTKTEAYDNVTIARIQAASQGVTITYPGSFITTKPTSGVTNASLGGCVASATTATSATKATQDASGNTITSTYATKSELNTAKSNLQASIDSKQATITGGASTITGSNLTANRALISNGSGKVAVSPVTSTELGYLDGVTSSIQTQLDGKSGTGHTHNYAGSSSAGGSANSAVKLATARTIGLNGDMTGSVSFNGSANATITAKRRRCTVGQNSNTTTNPYYKFASIKLTSSHTDAEIVFKVSTGYAQNSASGILRAHFRTNSDIKKETAEIYWEYANSGIDNSKFVMAYSNDASPTIELWVKIDASYLHYQFDVLQEHNRTEHINSWTLYNTSSAGSASAITSGYTQLESSFLTIKNPISGNAGTATKLTTSAGSATKPVYFSDGKPVACTYELKKTVPSDAVFTDTKYTHPTSSGNKHIPSGGSSGQILRWSADGTATWGADNNTTYSVVSTTADGLAPKRDGSTTKFLRADGTWSVPPNTDTKPTVITQSSYTALGTAVNTNNIFYLVN